jgi:hypothetical protein
MIDPPTNLYGLSSSCPFWIAREEIDGPPEGDGTIIVQKVTVPSTNVTSFNFSAGGGLSPDEFSLSHGESITFTEVPSGSGYSVEEEANELFTTTVSVSNGSPVGNITVSPGETVTVTFTNSLINSLPDSEVRLIRRVRRAPTLNEELKMYRYSSFQLDLEPGVSLIDGQGSDAVVNLRWSDDGGHTWSNLYPQPIGRQGRYQTRVFWERLGASRNRVFEVSMSDPVPWVLIDAYLRFTEGTGN